MLRLMTFLFSAVVLVAVTGCASGPSRSSAGSSTQNSLSGAYLQGRFAAQDFNIPRADQAFSEVAAQQGSEASKRLAFAYAVAAGSMEEAERQARLIVNQPTAQQDGSPSTLQIDLPRLTLAAAAMREGDAEEARAWLEEPLISPLGRSLATLLISAATFELEGMTPAAKVVAAQDPGSYRGLVPLYAGALFALGGDLGAAEAMYRQALNAPRGEVAAIGFARLLEDTERTDDANRIYRQLLSDAGLYMRAGRMGLVRTGALEGAPKPFRGHADDQPPLVTDARALFAFALESYAWLGFEQAAGMDANGPLGEQARQQAFVVPLALANIARATDPSRDAAHYIAMLTFSFFDTPDAAIEASDAIPPQSWLYSFAQLERATVMARRDEAPSAARASLRSAMRKDGGTNPPWGLQLHIYAAAEEDYTRADDYVTEAIAMAEALEVQPPSLWRYYFARGAARVEADRFSDGAADLEKALELAPDEPIILNHLGYSYVERGEQLDRAFGMIEAALERAPQNGAIVDSLGWAHFQQGNYDQAVTWLEDAVALEPSDAVITDHLGDAYYMVGRDRDAQFEWVRVRDLDDADDELLEEVERKLSGDFSQSPILSARGKNP